MNSVLFIEYPSGADTSTNVYSAEIFLSSLNSYNQIGKENEIPIITLNLINNKIPTYALQLTKYAKGKENKVLEKAQYKIYGEGIANNGKIYETDENGIFTIDGLLTIEPLFV